VPNTKSAVASSSDDILTRNGFIRDGLIRDRVLAKCDMNLIIEQIFLYVTPSAAWDRNHIAP
jgi:hypothetical protein